MTDVEYFPLICEVKEDSFSEILTDPVKSQQADVIAFKVAVIIPIL